MVWTLILLQLGSNAFVDSKLTITFVMGWSCPDARCTAVCSTTPVSQQDRRREIRQRSHGLIYCDLCTTSCSRMGSLPLSTVLHERPQHGSFPQAAVLLKLLQWGSLHKVQSLRNRLLSRNSPQGHKACQQTFSSMDFPLHKATGTARSPLWHQLSMEEQPPSGIQLIQCGILCGLQLDLCSRRPSMGCRGTACLTMSSPQIEGNLLWHLEPLLPLLHHWPWCLHSSCSHFSLLFLKCSCAPLLNPFWNILSHQCHWWALLWPVVDPSCRQLALALSDTGEVLVPSHRSCPCSPPDTKNLPHKPGATFSSYDQWWSLIHEMPASDYIDDGWLPILVILNFMTQRLLSRLAKSIYHSGSFKGNFLFIS